MKFARALAFSIAAPVANLGAILMGAFLTTGARSGFTPALAAQTLEILGKWFSPGWLMVMALAAAFSFGAWLMVRRAGSRSGPLKIILLVLATLVIALLPLGLALIVFASPILGAMIVLTVSAAAVAIAARGPVHQTRPISTSPIPSHHIGFGRRGQPPTA